MHWRVHGVARRLALLVACTAVAVAGCGAGDDRSEIKASVKGLQAALATGDLAGACDRLTDDAHRHIGEAAHDPPTTCERDLRLVYDGLKRGEGLRSAAERKIRRVAVDGDDAVAVVAVGDGAVRVPLAKEDGEWKVDALYGGVPADLQKDSFPPPGTKRGDG